MNSKKIEPSLLSIDKNNAINQLKIIRDLGIKYVHYDVMERKFCGQVAFDTEYLNEIEKLGLKANVHLMVNQPEKWLTKYKQFNLNSIGFHAETQSISNSEKILKKIKNMKFKTMFSVKIKTDLSKYETLLPYIDIILVMSVEPGLGGQKFDSCCLHNLKIAKQFKTKYPNLIISIDGGINNETIPQISSYVDWYVSGNWFFKNIGIMKKILKKYCV